MEEGDECCNEEILEDDEFCCAMEPKEDQQGPTNPDALDGSNGELI